MDADNRIWWGRKGDAIPQIKRFLSEVKQGRVPQTLWPYDEVGHTQDAKKELVAICDFEDSASVFITPKPTSLLQRIVEIGADDESLIMDSFAGSGTTGHAVMQMNNRDGGSRRFIMVEIDDKIAGEVTAQRLTRAVEGYHPGGDTSKQQVPALGSGFRFCRLGKPLFDENGSIAEEVSFTDLAAHVFFTETGSPIPKRARKDNPLLGSFDGRAIYLLYNGVLGDRRPESGNVLTHAVAQELPPHPDGAGPRVVFGEACRLGAKALASYGITYRQIPFELKVS